MPSLVHVSVYNIHCCLHEVHVSKYIHEGNIRVFCRVRPLLPGELSSTGLNDSTASADNGSQTAVKADRGNLHIEYPDKEGDCRKISIQFFPYQVKCCSLQCTCTCKIVD